jgi:glycosyltransferase involved in cell wall biosynthesis
MPRHAPLAERLRYLATFAEHAAFAAALRTGGHAGGRTRAAHDRLHVTFLSPFPPSQHGTVSRFSHWLPQLRGMGCEPDLLTPCSDAEFARFGHGDARADQRFYHACVRNQWVNIRRAAEADAVVLHRGLFPFSPWQRPTFEHELARRNPHIVYDFFDAIWLARQEANRLPSRPARWLNPADKIEQIMNLAAVVTVSNETLAQWARPRQRDVRIVPMLIDIDDYELRRHEPRSPVVLGWVGNRFQVSRLLSLAPALRRLAESREILVRVVSSEPLEIPGVPVECRTHPWSPDSDREDFADLDIGLLPLDDTGYDRGKSPFKLLQYAAAGLPVVATPVAIDQAIMPPGRAFLPARNEGEWFDSLTRLVDDVQLRDRLGQAARAAVQRHYSYAAYADAFLDALVTAAGWAAAPGA